MGLGISVGMGLSRFRPVQRFGSVRKNQTGSGSIYIGEGTGFLSFEKCLSLSSSRPRAEKLSSSSCFSRSSSYTFFFILNHFSFHVSSPLSFYSKSASKQDFKQKLNKARPKMRDSKTYLLYPFDSARDLW
jgi:hypothetical protein